MLLKTSRTRTHLGGAALLVGLTLSLTGLQNAALSPSRASAESGEFNLHLDIGPGFGLTDPLPNASGTPPVGIFGNVAFDWQIVAPIALEIQAGGGYLFETGFNVARDGMPYFNVGLGARVRPFDNREGYLANDGDILGNLWIAAHLGFHFFDGPQFGIDAAVGYEFSIIDPLQLGVFARGAVLIEGDHAGIDAILVFGINGSIELGGQVDALDRDGDGLSDDRERNQYETDPTDPDTDDDFLQDGVEVNGPTNPLVADTDGDGALDGNEDRNHNGIVDPGEADPMVPDTDSGGVQDGWELEHNLDPTDATDDDADGDGVLANLDECADTAAGAEVNERGCVVIRERMVLRGVNFAYNSADILPESASQLQIALGALRDNPDIRVEIGGHTDNQGGRSYNRDLSRRRAESVRDWLIQNGIDGSRMTTRGYGFDQPVESNDTEEGRAQNRRIEFNVIQ